MELASTWVLCTTVSVACVIVVLVSLLWRILNWVWFRPKRLEKCFRGQGFGGNPYRLLYGDTKDKARMVADVRSKPMSQLSHDLLPRALPFLHHTVKNYGKRSIIWNGPTPVVTIAEPELMREVLMKISEFQKPKSNPFLLKIATGLVQVEGDEWAKRRKLINPAFHMQKLKVMFPAFLASSHEMIRKWEEKIISGTEGSCEVDAWTYFHNLSADIISRAAFGSSFEEGRRIFQLMTQQLIVAVPVLDSVYIPGWRFVPTNTNKRITKIDREIRTLLKDIVHKRKKAINAGEKTKDDLLGLLMKSNTLQEDIQLRNDKHMHAGLSLGEIIDECKIFYLAGQETTSALLSWTLILLGKHQDWQSRAREEVVNTFGNNNPDFHGLNQLKTVNMIFQEVLRLYTPIVELNRTVCEDIKVGDIFLPEGVLVNLPILLIHQDEKLWGPDAKEFKPERFAQGISKATGGDMSFFSFGWGPRICIGSNFSMTEAKMALALILQRFSFELSPSYAHAPVVVGTLRPQHGAPIILHHL